MKRIKNSKFGRLIAEKDKYCRLCLYNGKIVLADDPAHIVAKSSLGDDVEENGIGFCRQHHTEYDNYITKLPWQLLQSDELAYVLKKKYVGWKKINWSGYEINYGKDIFHDRMIKMAGGVDPSLKGFKSDRKTATEIINEIERSKIS